MEITIQDSDVAVYREYMQEHVIIYKIMVIWPTKRALKGCIHGKWNPKGEIDLQLGSKGFFTIFFTLLEDRDRIVEGGPYFFNSAWLYMRFWKEKFTPEKEYFTRILQNKAPAKEDQAGKKYNQGYTKVGKKHKKNKRVYTKKDPPMFSQQNKFEALNTLQEETGQQSIRKEANIQQENSMEKNNKEMEAQNKFT